jgi:hypothetical protein
VLHVVYNHNTQLDGTIDKDGNFIEIFELQNFLDDDIKRIFAGYQKQPTLPEKKFCTFFASETPELIQPLLIKYGMLRILEKQKRFAAELYFTGFNQLAYQGILEALGYSKNKYQMLQLANLIPYADLRKFARDGMNLHDLIAIWLNASGLIDKLPATFPPEFILKWKELFARQNFFQKPLSIQWNLFRLRPVNHPAIRLLQIADLVYDSLSGSLFNQFIRLFSFPAGKFKMKDFYQRLYDLFLKPNNFLPEKYNLGKTRLDTIFINIILPLILLYAQNNQFNELADTVNEIYRQFHALPHNNISRSMYQFMDSSQIKLARSKAIYQQALLHIYNSFCRFHTCSECLIEKKLNRET